MRLKDRRWLKGLIIIFLLLLAIPSIQGIRKLYSLSMEKARMVAENQALREENERLKREIERLKNDPSYIERIARKELGMIGENEVIYQFTE